MAQAKKDLVIVESPAKARTIEKYLGGDYKVIASMGHLRDLPKSKLGVDIEHGFTPEYIPVAARADVINELKTRSKEAGTVYLATDPDREGEAISWHLKELLNIPGEKARRVTFNEITKKVVQESIANPRDIDQDLVDAQQARRILDRIVGYKLSPFLWRKVRRGLSAGRVQSVAIRMVVDRENEIRAFRPEEYWYLDAHLDRSGKKGGFVARYYGSADKKKELHSEKEVEDVIAAVEKAAWEIGSVKRGERQRSPSPPFITSTLQQEASRRLGLTPRRTMSIAQQLYEGVDITGEGTVGLITYMRTDSLRLSEEAMAAAGSFIRSFYGDEYYYGKPRRYKTKAGAQDAHEAIRPSNVYLTPERVKKDLTAEQYRLYRLIWGRFTASQMANAVYDNVVIDALSAGHCFKANHSSLRFPGYTAVYEDPNEDEETGGKKPLPDLAEGEIVTLKKLDKEQRFTEPPARYTEATLIRAMEEKGMSTEKGVIGINMNVENEALNHRIQAFRDYIAANAPKLEMTETYYNNNVVEKSQTNAENIISSYGSDLIGMYSGNNITADGVANAVRAANLKDNFVSVGVDSDDIEIQALRDGFLSAIIVQNAYDQGYKVMENAIRTVVDGKNPEEAKQINCPPVIVTLENIDSPEIEFIMNPQLSK